MANVLCLVCNKEFKSNASLTYHAINTHNITPKQYYDTYILSHDIICPFCNKEYKFLGISQGYRTKHSRCGYNIPKFNQNTKCEICKRDFNNTTGLVSHLVSHNIKSKEYYDLYLRKETSECICIICGADSNFNSINKGYYKTCGSRICMEKYGRTKKVQTCLNKYGVSTPFENQEVRNVYKQNCIEKYGVDNPFKVEDFKDKYKQTCLEKYGYEHPCMCPNIKRKTKNTNIEKYNVPNPIQNVDIHIKQQKSAFRLKDYKTPSGIMIKIQGYEPQFLDHIFDANLITDTEIIYTPKSVKYINYKNTHSYYFPDFYIPKYNLIIEIKSSYTERADKNVDHKKAGCLNKGFKYLRIVDNKFEEFDKYLKENKI